MSDSDAGSASVVGHSGQQTLGTAPYAQSVDEARQFDVECSCGRSARLHCYPGRDWPWKHDMVTGPGHVVSYSEVADE